LVFVERVVERIQWDFGLRGISFFDYERLAAMATSASFSTDSNAESLAGHKEQSQRGK
jgi:hypothetical protein